MFEHLVESCLQLLKIDPNLHNEYIQLEFYKARSLKRNVYFQRMHNT